MVPIFHYNVEICRRHFYFSEEKRGKIVKRKYPCHFSKKITHPVIHTYYSDLSFFFQVQFFFFTHLGRLLSYKLFRMTSESKICSKICTCSDNIKIFSRYAESILINHSYFNLLNSHLEVIWFLRNYHPITGIIYFVYIISACAFNGKLNRR